ncbi:DNA mismatch repair protein MutS2 [Enterococcus sp. DIV0212c]|uniref:endonuclease MutS2 n=1 Tax=Enterococcus sp. DIV0212c TaxID=2230867 RepID=UPI001A9AF4C9|nr:endonuclease MutS2 [Enterococcus sp. DIV0212c]MBO1353231.1 endonuclease MutS2 [Enterococcus sp. DIV0212c]
MNQETYNKTQFNTIKEKLMTYAISSYGKARIQVLEPSSRIEVVKKRLQETSEAKALLMANLHVPFMGLNNIEHLTSQVEKGFILEPSELVSYADFLRSCRLIQSFMQKNNFIAPFLARYSESLQLFSTIEDEIYHVIRNNQVENDASRELRKIRRAIQECEKEIEMKLQSFLRNTQNKPKIQEAIIVKKNDRFTVPIKATYKNQISGTVVDASSKGTTVFIEPAAITKLNDKLYQLKMEEVAEVYQILSTLTGLIAEQMIAIHSNIEVIAQYDMIFAKAKYSREINGIEPEINQEGIIQFVNVKHTLLGEAAVPLNVSLGKEYRGLTITGPNAGGKTVVLKTVGLISLQTMIGVQIIADAGTNVAIFDQIFVDIGDQQSIENALSTFSGHMQNISEILAKTKQNSLILLDEIGSGTEPNEGAALAIAIMEAFYKKGSILITTTHYGEIKRFSEQHEDFLTAAMAFDSENLMPKYQLILGETGESNAFWIANKMNLDKQVVKLAQNYLHDRNYSTKKADSLQKVRKQKEQTVFPNYEKGDRVFWTEKKKIGLVYESVEMTDDVIIYVDNEKITVHKRQLKLDRSAKELYPPNYDLDSLFEHYHDRKRNRDLERGSKKAHKKLRKEMQERQAKRDD